MTTPEAKLNGSTELLAEALRKVFEEAQESTIFLMGEVEGRLESKIGGLEGRLESKIDGIEGKIDDLEIRLDSKINGIDAKVDGMREQMNGMSKKIDRLQAGQ